MQQKVLLLNDTIGRNKEESFIVIHCLTECDTTNVPICYYNGNAVPIKLIEIPSPLVHLHSTQGRKTNKGLL